MIFSASLYHSCHLGVHFPNAKLVFVPIMQCGRSQAFALSLDSLLFLNNPFPNHAPNNYPVTTIEIMSIADKYLHPKILFGVEYEFDFVEEKSLHKAFEQAGNGLPPPPPPSNSPKKEKSTPAVENEIDVVADDNLVIVISSDSSEDGNLVIAKGSNSSGDKKSSGGAMEVDKQSSSSGSIQVDKKSNVSSSTLKKEDDHDDHDDQQEKEVVDLVVRRTLLLLSCLPKAEIIVGLFGSLGLRRLNKTRPNAITNMLNRVAITTERKRKRNTAKAARSLSQILTPI